MQAARHIPQLACAAVLVAGCSRDSEAEMRARLAPWFVLGKTLAFEARMGCAAAAFRLTAPDIGAGLPVRRTVPDWLQTVTSRGVGALESDDDGPDAAMVSAANALRETGMAMRRISLEARACMDDRLRTEFTRMLLSKGIIVGFDARQGALYLVDRRNAVLLVAMGERP